MTLRQHLMGLALAALLPVGAMAATGAVPDEQALLAAPEKIARLLEGGQLAPEQVPNPHWREDGCSACHSGSTAPSRATLRKQDVGQVCGSCHETTLVEAYIHAVGMTPPEDFLARMPEGFRQAIDRGGQVVTCITCHDLPLQCDTQRFAARGENPRFFRGGPYAARTDLCFNCHNPQKYERHNPHDQISDEGVLNTQSCYFCHNATPNRRQVRSIDDVTFSVEKDLKQLCTGCHPYRPHPGGGEHLKVPPKPIERHMQQIAKREGIVLPLEPRTGKIFCGTCHNPHERGVQHALAADKGADGFKRLRRGAMQICMNCHDK